MYYPVMSLEGSHEAAELAVPILQMRIGGYKKVQLYSWKVVEMGVE